MLSSLLRSLPWRRWKPLNFTNTNFVRIPEWHKIEEETLRDYVATQYYPTRVGEIIKERYQVVGKLGFGSTSTAWLARDMDGRRYVMLKIFIQASSMGEYVDDELKTYKHIEQSRYKSKAARKHPGGNVIRTLLDSFSIQGPYDKHYCLVHPPLWESVLTFLRRNPIERLPSPVLVVILQRVFWALDYLHTHCQLIHTDVKADNIMIGTHDDSIFTAVEETELQRPIPRKEIDTETDKRTIYMSQELNVPKRVGGPVLCDFGSAMSGEKYRTEFVQPNIYRAPEVILNAPWTYSIDVWNVGCMIWDLYEGGCLFTGQDPEFERYRSRAHLAEMINLLGPPPPSLLAQGELRDKFFTEQGEFRTESLLTERVPLEQRENNLEGLEEREAFLRLMRRMLQWDPSKRSSPKELAEDEWLYKHM